MIYSAPSPDAAMRSTTRVVLIGASGVLGREATRGLGRCKGLHLIRSSSKPGKAEVRIDLGSEETFDALRAGDLVVNCAPVTPDQVRTLAHACGRVGAALVETSAIPAVIGALLGLRAAGWAPEGGTFVLAGWGLFPGLTNVLAGAVVAGEPWSDLSVGVRLSPISRAGPGMIDLMTEQIATPAVVIREGVKIEKPALSAGPELRFASVRRGTQLVNLPETAMLHASTGVASVCSAIAVRPRLLQPAIRALAAVLPRTPAARRCGRGFLRASLRVTRGGVFVRLDTAVTLAAHVHREGESRGRSVTVSRALPAAGFLVAAGCDLLTRQQHRPSGVVLPDELFGLDEVVEAASRIAGEELSITLHPKALPKYGPR